MESKEMGWCILALAMLGFASSAHVSHDDLSCEQALTYVIPCVSFFNGSGTSTPSSECCLGLQKVLNEVPTTPIMCECFKQFVEDLGDDIGRLESIPKLCKVKLPAPLDPNVDCITVPSSTKPREVREA